MPPSRWVPLLLFAVGALGCWPGPEVGPVIAGQSDTIAANAPLSTLQTKILTPDCATSLCHREKSPYAPLSLEDGQSYGALVNRPAAQAPSILLVNPGHPDESYLMLKMLGTVGTSGSASTRMPPNKPALSADRIEAVRAWILRGAPND